MNLEIAEIFYQIADILELKKDRWRPIAYRAAAQTIESLKKDVQDIYLEKGEKGLEEIPGIGKALAGKIVQYIKTEKIDKLEKLKKEIPAGLYEMMNIPGVGAKKAEKFYKLGIKNVAELKTAAEKHRLLKLPGFREKAEKNIISGIETLKASKGRIPLKEAEKISGNIVRELKKLKEVEKVETAGSIRRRKAGIGDIDIVVLTQNPGKVGEKFVKMGFVGKILGKGKEKATIITKSGIQADLRFFTNEDFGSGLLYFTGDKNHNIWLRKIAIKKGLKLSEYGLFKGKKRVAGKTEKEIYEKLGLKYPEPEDRLGETS